jgi:hypothetical protein
MAGYDSLKKDDMALHGLWTCGQERIWIADLDVDDDNLLPTLRVLEGRSNDNGSPAERSRDMQRSPTEKKLVAILEQIMRIS